MEVNGLEPVGLYIAKVRFQRFDQALLEDCPGTGVAIPSGSLTIPSPSRTIRTRIDTLGQALVGPVRWIETHARTAGSRKVE